MMNTLFIKHLNFKASAVPTAEALYLYLRPRSVGRSCERLAEVESRKSVKILPRV
ncbi:hypothetical protein ABID22_001712 [Pontibacter aydingkolensis]